MSAATIADATRRTPFGTGLLVVVCALVLLWPALINGSALTFYDSPSYMNGGRTATERAGAIAESACVAIGFCAARPASPAPVAQAEAPPAEAPALNATSEGQVRGIRSVTYSLVAFVLYDVLDSTFTVVAVQSLAVVLVLWAFTVASVGPIEPWRFALGIAALSALTSLAGFVSYLTPDIFAAVVILAIAGLTVADGTLRRAERLVLAVLLCFAITAHYSHLPLALVLAVLAVVLRAALLPGLVRPVLWIGVPIAAAIAANGAFSLATFGESSITPKRYPFLLARSLEDGPARYYLQEACGHIDYAVCELYGTNPPGSVQAFLWGYDGIERRATLEQFRRIQDEELTIVAEAVRAYPLIQTQRALGNWWRQIHMISMSDLGWNHLVVADDGRFARQSNRQVSSRAINLILTNLQTGVVVLSVLALAVVLGFGRGRLSRGHLVAGALVLAGVLTNAAICGALSAPDDRYQARVVWLIPLLALLALPALQQRTPPSARSGRTAAP